jgi:hypothetical protein
VSVPQTVNLGLFARPSQTNKRITTREVRPASLRAAGQNLSFNSHSPKSSCACMRCNRSLRHLSFPALEFPPVTTPAALRVFCGAHEPIYQMNSQTSRRTRQIRHQTHPKCRVLKPSRHRTEPGASATGAKTAFSVAPPGSRRAQTPNELLPHCEMPNELRYAANTTNPTPNPPQMSCFETKTSQNRIRSVSDGCENSVRSPPPPFYPGTLTSKCRTNSTAALKYGSYDTKSTPYLVF